MIIVITSGGCNWMNPKTPETGEMHDRKIVQIIFDVRRLIADSAKVMPTTSGTESAAREWTLGQSGAVEWLNQREREILEAIKTLHDSGKILHIGFRCTGGFQRSVVLAEEMARRLKEKLGKTHTIIVHHMTMDLALAIKKHLGV